MALSHLCCYHLARALQFIVPPPVPLRYQPAPRFQFGTNVKSQKYFVNFSPPTPSFLGTSVLPWPGNVPCAWVRFLYRLSRALALLLLNTEPRSSRRCKITQLMRIRPSDPQRTHFDDMRGSISVSRTGVYFQTSETGYEVGMRLF